MKAMKQVVCTVVMGLCSSIVLADVDCSTDTCVSAQGTVEQVGLDNAGVMHEYSSAFPVATPTDPYIFVKVTGTDIGLAFTNCSVGNDAAIGLIQYNSIPGSGSTIVDVRKAIYSTVLAAKTSAQTIMLTINDDSTCEIGAAIVTVP